jgi:hypothetical protein
MSNELTTHLVRAWTKLSWASSSELLLNFRAMFLYREQVQAFLDAVTQDHLRQFILHIRDLKYNQTKEYYVLLETRRLEVCQAVTALGSINVAVFLVTSQKRPAYPWFRIDDWGLTNLMSDYCLDNTNRDIFLSILKSVTYESRLVSNHKLNC